MGDLNREAGGWPLTSGSKFELVGNASIYPA